MSNLKYKIEALLFSSARSMTLDELANLTKAKPEEIKEKIDELKEEYGKRDSSITLIDEGSSFKLNIKSEHSSVVHQVVTQTELSKTLMETLAVIAFKYPIKQADLIKMRTNKAYDHLKELEESGYIIRQKYGRTKLIKLTPKFFEYFDLPEDKLKSKFEGFEGIAKAIGDKEEEIKSIKAEMKKKAEEAGKKKAEEPEVDLVDGEGHKQKLEVYEETDEEKEAQEAKKVEPYTDKVGDLDVVDVPEKEESDEMDDSSEDIFDQELSAEKESEKNEDAVDELSKLSEGIEEEPEEKEVTRDFEGKGIEMDKKRGDEAVGIVGDMTGKEFESKGDSDDSEKKLTPEEVDKKVDEKVEELVHSVEAEE
ncbi:MAG: SMC-Scp complex subunit ScpB, partial [Nanoarchaeota archaeon]|nr:SMC-Scp complex subunit ScpB [Nanoarchaeota archaeon]